MKTVFNSDPEFSINFTHCGVSLTLSGKVSTQDYLSTADSEAANEELLGKVLASALQRVAQQAARQLTEFHFEFQGALGVALVEDREDHRASVSALSL